MLLRESGFTFGTRHSRRDMGLIYAEKDGHIVIPEIKRNSYSIAGMSGTLLLAGEAWQPFNIEGTLYPANEPATQADAQDMLRDVAAWLTNGRQRLIFDYEPNIYYLAELSAASKWSLKNWFGGELQVRWTAQPFAYNVEEDTASLDVSSGGSKSVTLRAYTGLPAPLKLTVRNTGSAPITRVSFGGITLAGMSIGAGSTLVVDSEPPAGAKIGSSNALSYCTAWQPYMVNNGNNTIYVNLTFGSGTAGAKITASARGRR